MQICSINIDQLLFYILDDEISRLQSENRILSEDLRQCQVFNSLLFTNTLLILKIDLNLNILH